MIPGFFESIKASGFAGRVTPWLLVLCLAPHAIGQDLVTLARLEKERRAKIAKLAPVYTDGNLSEGAATPGAPKSPEASSNPAPQATPRAPRPAPDAEKPAWKARADSAREGIAREQQALAALVAEIGRLRSDITPLSAEEALDPMRRQKRADLLRQTVERRKVQEQVLASAKEALEALEQAARQAGIPPGWLR